MFNPIKVRAAVMAAYEHTTPPFNQPEKEENANADALATHAAMQMQAALQMQNDFDAAVQQYQDYVDRLQVEAANAAAMPPMMFI